MNDKIVEILEGALKELIEEEIRIEDTQFIHDLASDIKESIRGAMWTTIVAGDDSTLPEGDEKGRYALEYQMGKHKHTGIVEDSGNRVASYIKRLSVRDRWAKRVTRWREI